MAHLFKDAFKGTFNSPVGRGIVVNGKPVAFFAYGQEVESYVRGIYSRAAQVNAEVVVERYDYLDNPHGDILVVPMPDTRLFVSDLPENGNYPLDGEG